MLIFSGASSTLKAGISLNIRSAGFAAANICPMPKGRNPRVSRCLFAHRLCLFMVLSLTENPGSQHRHQCIARQTYLLFRSIPAMLVCLRIFNYRGGKFQRHICVNGPRASLFDSCHCMRVSFVLLAAPFRAILFATSKRKRDIVYQFADNFQGACPIHNTKNKPVYSFVVKLTTC